MKPLKTSPEYTQAEDKEIHVYMCVTEKSNHLQWALIVKIHSEEHWLNYKV